MKAEVAGSAVLEQKAQAEVAKGAKCTGGRRVARCNQGSRRRVSSCQLGQCWAPLGNLPQRSAALQERDLCGSTPHTHRSEEL